MLAATNFALADTAGAGAADVLAVEAFALPAAGQDVVRFRVTVRHADAGWAHYADRWEVLAPDGTLLGARVLAHPHDDEQPFTRSGDIVVPDGIDTVTVRARDRLHGHGGQEMTVTIRR